MKILPLVNSIKRDIAISGLNLKNATNDGITIASRTAQIYKQNQFTKCLNIARCVSNRLIKNTTRRELPYMAGAIGMLLPIPLSSPILLGLGFIVRFSLPDPEFDNSIENNQDKKINKIV